MIQMLPYQQTNKEYKFIHLSYKIDFVPLLDRRFPVLQHKRCPWIIELYFTAT